MPLLIYIFIAFYRLFLAAGQTKEEERRMRIIRDIFTCGTRIRGLSRQRSLTFKKVKSTGARCKYERNKTTQTSIHQID
jgi:hypothetical protein